jgi:hypothetical protein
VFTLSSMVFLLACRTASHLPSFLLHNGLKPFSANTARTLSTYIFCHFKISSIRNRKKNTRKWNIGKQRRGIGGIAGYVFFCLAGYCGGVNPLQYFVTDSGLWRYTIRFLTYICCLAPGINCIEEVIAIRYKQYPLSMVLIN